VIGNYSSRTDYDGITNTLYSLRWEDRGLRTELAAWSQTKTRGERVVLDVVELQISCYHVKNMHPMALLEVNETETCYS